MGKEATPCPSCGSATTRPLTRKEWRARNDGQDPVVVVMPRTCTACGHVWEPPLSRGVCYVVAVITGIGFLIGLTLFVGGVWMLIQLKLTPLGGANNAKNQGALAAGAMTGFALAGGAGAMCWKYLRLARQR